MKRTRKHHRRGEAKKNTIEFVFLIFLVVLLVSLVIFYSFKNKKNLPENDLSQIESDKREKILPSNNPTPKPIPNGKVEFEVSVGKKAIGPKMISAFVDPYDPRIGEKQVAGVDLTNLSPIEKVVAILRTDNKTSKEYELTQASGDSKDKGHWEGSWTVDDSYLYKYTLTFKATASNGTSKVEITLR